MKFRSRPDLTIIMALAFSCSTPASAASINDVSAWSADFQHAAENTDAEKMDRMIEDAKDPRMNAPQLKTACLDFIKSIISNTDEKAIYTDIIEDKSIGKTLRRMTIAAVYGNHPLFYQITFLRKQDGWQIIFVNLNTDINKTLQAEWPRW